MSNVCSQCDRTLPPDAPDSLCPYCLLALDETADQLSGQAGNRGRFEPPEPEELQQHFDLEQIEVFKLIGSGGMGAVYHAKQTRLLRDIALKILPPELAMTPGFDDRFAREARVLAQLNHSSIVDVHEFGKAGPYSYLMLEYVDGVNLRDLMLGGMMEPTDALEIIPQICDALQFAHDNGIVHRDVKPENILIDTKGRIKITDFGLAKLARAEAGQRNLTGTYQVMGTPNYMAPEQIEKPRQVDHRADIYALGVVFYELLTGELPLGRFDPPSRRGSGSRRLDRIVMKTLEKEPSRRYDHASEVKDDVKKAAGDGTRTGAVASEVADHASQFYQGLNLVADSVKQAASEFFSKHPRLAKFVFPTAILAFYFACYLTVVSFFAFLLLTPVFAAVAYVLALLIEHEWPKSKRGKAFTLLARPPLWIAGISKNDDPPTRPTAPSQAASSGNSDEAKAADSKPEIDPEVPKDDRVDSEPAGEKEAEPVVRRLIDVPVSESQALDPEGDPVTDSLTTRRNSMGLYLPLAIIAFFCGIGSIAFGVMSLMTDGEFIMIAIPAALIGFVIARFVLSTLPPENTRLQKCLLYPPIGVFLVSVFAPLIAAPPVLVTTVMANEPHPAIVSAGLMSLFVWLGILMFVGRRFDAQVRGLMHPFLMNWNRRWAIFGSVTCAAGAAVFCAMTFMAS